MILFLKNNIELLIEYFNSFGEVVECIVMREKSSKKSRGFGFIVFKNEDTINKVVAYSSTKPHILQGKQFECKAAISKESIEDTKDKKTSYPSTPNTNFYNTIESNMLSLSKGNYSNILYNDLNMYSFFNSSTNIDSNNVLKSNKSISNTHSYNSHNIPMLNNTYNNSNPNNINNNNTSINNDCSLSNNNMYQNKITNFNNISTSNSNRNINNININSINSINSIKNINSISNNSINQGNNYTNFYNRICQSSNNINCLEYNNKCNNKYVKYVTNENNSKNINIKKNNVKNNINSIFPQSDIGTTPQYNNIKSTTINTTNTNNYNNYNSNNSSIAGNNASQELLFQKFNRLNGFNNESNKIKDTYSTIDDSINYHNNTQYKGSKGNIPYSNTNNKQDGFRNISSNNYSQQQPPNICKLK